MTRDQRLPQVLLVPSLLAACAQRLFPSALPLCPSARRSQRAPSEPMMQVISCRKSFSCLLKVTSANKRVDPSLRRQQPSIKLPSPSH